MVSSVAVLMSVLVISFFYVRVIIGPVKVAEGHRLGNSFSLC